MWGEKWVWCTWCWGREQYQGVNVWVQLCILALHCQMWGGFHTYMMIMIIIRLDWTGLDWQREGDGGWGMMQPIPPATRLRPSAAMARLSTKSTVRTTARYDTAVYHWVYTVMARAYNTVHSGSPWYLSALLVIQASTSYRVPVSSHLSLAPIAPLLADPLEPPPATIPLTVYGILLLNYCLSSFCF